MPNPGDACNTDGDIDFDTTDGSVLVCRDNRWQRIAEPPPSTAAEERDELAAGEAPAAEADG